MFRNAVRAVLVFPLAAAPLTFAPRGAAADVDEIHWTVTGPASVAVNWRGDVGEIRYGETPGDYPYRFAAGDAALGALGEVAAGNWYDIALDGLTGADLDDWTDGDGRLALRLLSTVGNGADYRARESGALAPRLIVTVAR